MNKQRGKLLCIWDLTRKRLHGGPHCTADAQRWRRGAAPQRLAYAVVHSAAGSARIQGRQGCAKQSMGRRYNARRLDHKSQTKRHVSSLGTVCWPRSSPCLPTCRDSLQAAPAPDTGAAGAAQRAPAWATCVPRRASGTRPPAPAPAACWRRPRRRWPRVRRRHRRSRAASHPGAQRGRHPAAAPAGRGWWPAAAAAPTAGPALGQEPAAAAPAALACQRRSTPLMRCHQLRPDGLRPQPLGCQQWLAVAPGAAMRLGAAPRAAAGQPCCCLLVVMQSGSA